MSFLKSAFRTIMSLPKTPDAFQFLIRDCAVVFMLHRFEGPDPEVCSPRSLRNALAYLRRKDYKLLPLSSVFRRLSEGVPVTRTVVFTIDDGYRDLAVIAPTFAEFDCPVTAFLTTGFIDGKIWMWWDRISYIFQNTDRSDLDVTIAGAVIRYALTDVSIKESACQDLVARCKRLTEEEKLSLINALAVTANVELPIRPPDDCSPVTWADVRRCERAGMEFGPHSITHPILSLTSDEQSSYEIRESWSRLKTETEHAVPIFCYPNGLHGDFGEREIKELSNLGFEGAVVSWSGYASASAFKETKDARFQVPRLWLPNDLVDLSQRVGGVERAKELLRRNR